MKTNDLIAEAAALPVEERAMIVDSLLKSLGGFCFANPRYKPASISTYTFPQ